MLRVHKLHNLTKDDVELEVAASTCPSSQDTSLLRYSPDDAVVLTSGIRGARRWVAEGIVVATTRNGWLRLRVRWS